MAWDKASRVEIVAGRFGFYNLRNGNQVPLGGLIALRNATLADRAWRTGGGASKFGAAPAATPGRAAIDYWPTLAQQRLVACYADGSIRKDNGAGGGWTSLQAGLTTAGFVPMFSVAGRETAASNKKLYYADRINAPLFLNGDGGAMAALPSLNPDWGAGNYPGWFQGHQGYNWAGGNLNGGHIAYRSLGTDHGDFGTTPFRIPCGPLDLQQRTVGAIPYGTGLVVFCFPVGVYYIDTSDPSPANWFAAIVARAGAAGPRCFAQVEEDIVWVSVDGSWHSLRVQFGQAKASVRATDISYRALAGWAKVNTEQAQAANFDLIYHDAVQEMMLSYTPAGGNAKNRRLHGDMNNVGETGGAPNWITWDRDDNEALFMRQETSTVGAPAMIDDVGQTWMLSRDARNKGGMGYTFEFFLQDSDFSMVYPNWAGRLKNARYVQVEYVASKVFTLTLEIYMDGEKVDEIPVTLEGGNAVLPAVLPFNMGSFNMLSSDPLRLDGQFRRLAVRGYVSEPDADCAIVKIIIGAELAP